MPPTYQATQEAAGLILSEPQTPSVSSSAEGGISGPVKGGALLCFPKVRTYTGAFERHPLKSSWGSILGPLQFCE